MAPIGVRNLICFLAGLTATLMCGIGTVTRGLELLFLLPVAFTICSLLFSRAFSYWRENVAFVIIFATIGVRYLVTPVLMTLSGTALTTVSPSPGYYRLAIFTQIFELFATLAVIDYVWTRHKRKVSFAEKSSAPSKVDFKLSWLGTLLLLALVVLEFSRSQFLVLMNRYSTWWRISNDFSAIYFYDYICVEVVKAVVAVSMIAFFAKQFYKTKSLFIRVVCYLLAVVMGASTTMLFMFDQRTSLVQLVISALMVLVAFFPDQKKLSFTVFGIGGSFLVAYVFASGSMRTESGGGFVAELSKMAELYVSGPSMVAITQQKYGWVRSNMSAMTYLSDLITSSHIFGMFPFLRGINNLVAGVPTTNILFVQSLGGLTYILPNYSLWTYYATDLFGWLFEILSIYLVVRMICYADDKKKQVGDACYYYALVFTETLLGQAVFVNNTFLLWHTFTGLPIWLLIFAYVNRLGKKFRLK